MAARLRWAGHVAKMGETRIPRMLPFGELEQGTRHVGRPLKRYSNAGQPPLRPHKYCIIYVVSPFTMLVHAVTNSFG